MPRAADTNRVARYCGASGTGMDRIRQPIHKEAPDGVPSHEATGPFLVLLDREGRIVQCNQACEHFTGYSASELKGTLLWEAVARPESHSRTRDFFPALISARSTGNFEDEWLTKSGEVRRVSLSTAVLPDQDGTVQSLIVKIGRASCRERWEIACGGAE